MLVTILLFFVGLGLLVKGADFFVGGGSGLASRYGVSASTIGFTVIAFGTSLPEFVVSVNAAATRNGGIALGNVLGSNIANIALVLALCALLKPSLLGRQAFSPSRKHEYLLMLGATAAFTLIAVRGVLDWLSGAFLLILFIIILRLLWKDGKQDSPKFKSHGRRDYISTGGGLLAVAIGAQLVLDSAVTIAGTFGIPTFIIGLSMVAVGTSLPELATSLVAILKGEEGISVGNILGSNIFNLLFVLGSAALISSIAIPSFTDVLIVGAFSVGLLPLFWGSARFTRLWAVVLLAAYAIYISVIYGLV